MNNLTTTTMELTYEELEGAIISYLISSRAIDPNVTHPIGIDVDIALNPEGLVEFDLEHMPTSQLEFNIA